jgi:hypothetical protein
LAHKCIIRIVAGETPDIISSRIDLSLTNTPEEITAVPNQRQLPCFESDAGVTNPQLDKIQGSRAANPSAKEPNRSI